MGSPLKLARAKMFHFMKLFYSFVFKFYVNLRQFFPLLKGIRSVSSPAKWIDSLLSTNQSPTLPNSLFKTCLISVTSVCWKKMLVSSASSYVSLFPRTCGIPFIYNKNSQGSKYRSLSDSAVSCPCFWKYIV